MLALKSFDGGEKEQATFSYLLHMAEEAAQLCFSVPVFSDMLRHGPCAVLPGPSHICAVFFHIFVC